MDVEEWEEVQGYFRLRRKIERSRELLQETRGTFYSQNMFTRSIERYEEPFQTVAFDVEKNVIDFVDTQTRAERHIAKLEAKQRQFVRFLDDQTRDEKSYYRSRFARYAEEGNEILDKRILSAVRQIERTVKRDFYRESEAVEERERQEQEQRNREANQARFWGYFRSRGVNV